MVRRTFRIGLWLGLLGGALWAVRRTLQLRRATEGWSPSAAPWPPMAQTAPGNPAALPAAAPAPPPAAEELGTWPEPEPVAAPPVLPAPDVTAAPAKPPTRTKSSIGPGHNWVPAADGVCPQT